ncbi:hypothetical protein MUK42_28560 [Musa troglodytarum]|uniref:CCHC-type domain-containing protein n=1 Tax=Musa troglodytarum TaxID=320322 RepID=A0A9E7JS87_9LILI|nr:hypothetical protein MUK42_28560 [Musa troglodytarum]
MHAPIPSSTHAILCTWLEPRLPPRSRYKEVCNETFSITKTEDAGIIIYKNLILIFYVLYPNLQSIPVPTDNDTDEVKAERKKKNEDEVMCRGHILNALSDRLYDLYTVEPYAKGIGKRFYMTPRISPWSKFKNIFESRMRDKSENSFSNVKANVVKQPKNYNKGKQNKENHLCPKRDQGKFKKPKSGGCFVCGKPDHFARDCRFKKGQKSEVNSVEGDDNIIATVSEVNVIFGKVFGWWYDTCVTVHVCYDKTLFKTYKEVTDGQEIQMGNEVRSKAPKQWHEKFDATILSNGFVHNVADKCVYLKTCDDYTVEKKNCVNNSQASRHLYRRWQ